MVLDSVPNLKSSQASVQAVVMICLLSKWTLKSALFSKEAL